MAKEISWETREYAEELYIIDGFTFAQVSAKTGVSQTQLKNWSAAEGWRDRRREYRGTRRQIEEKTQKLRLKLVDAALDTAGDPQSAYAFARVERLVIEKQKEKAHEAVKNIEEKTKTLKKSLDPETLRIIREEVYGIV
jgi:predicted RND superfamily exporter protein